MLCLSGFELYSRWVPLLTVEFFLRTWELVWPGQVWQAP